MLLATALFKFIGSHRCFNYLKRRLPLGTVKSLDKLLTVRCRITRLNLRIRLIHQCLRNFLVPKYLVHRIHRLKYNFDADVSKNVLRAELCNLRSNLGSLHDELRKLRSSLPASTFSSFVVYAKYENFSSVVLRKTRASSAKQTDAILATAVSCLNVGLPNDVDKHIINKSTYDLSTVEKQALCRGLNFCIPYCPKQELVDCEFEKFFLQLSTLNPSDSDSVTKLKADLVSISKEFHKWKPSSNLPRTHLEALRNLKKNKDIVICKPDKGNAVVILNTCDYVQKVNDILSCDKFSVDQNNKDITSKLEKDVVKMLQSLRNKCLIDDSMFRKLKPIGCGIPKMYGLPKIHKDMCPVRPILSMVGSPTHALAQWLADILQPVNEAVSSFCVSDSFQFAESIRDTDLSDLLMVSFDISALFTNVPVRETVNMIRDLVSSHNISLDIPIDELCDLILLCVDHVQFSFNNRLFFQEDGIAMGSPLGPILSNIFVGYLEHFYLRDTINTFSVRYQRYVDDTFVIVRSENDANRLLSAFNAVHSNLKFTCEFQSDGCLPFLDVFVSRNKDGRALTAIYRKPTWTGLYLNYNSFVPLKYKSGLVHTLFDRARKICSPSTLPQEELLLFETLKDNGYPIDFLQKHSSPKNSPERIIGPLCKDVFLRIPFAGDAFTAAIYKRIHNSTKQAFPAANPRLIFSTRSIPVRPLKDPVPPLGKSHLIYKFVCDCGCSYIGRTERCVGVRIKEHLPRWIQTGKRGTPSSSVCRHAVDCDNFIGRDFPSYFSILTSTSFSSSLRILEALFIHRQKPPLCVQKDFVYSLLLPW